MLKDTFFFFSIQNFIHTKIFTRPHRVAADRPGTPPLASGYFWEHPVRNLGNTLFAQILA